MVNLFKNKQTIALSPSIVVFTVAFLLGLYFLFFIRTILIILFLSFIIVVALNPAIAFLNRRFRMPRAIAGAVMYLLIISLLIAVIAVVVPPLTSQLYQLLRMINLPLVQEELNNFSFNVSEIGNLVDRVSGSFGVLLSIVTSTFSGVFTFFTLLVISFYLMLERPVLHRKIMWFTKDQAQVLAFKNFLDSLEHQLGGWVRGQLILMLVIGVTTFIGLSLLGVPYALPLALIAGLLEIIPNLGPTLASIPAIILAYIYGGPVIFVMTVILYIVIQQLENNFIVPKIMKDSVDVNPLVSIVTILIGLQVAGVVGALLAVPTYIVIRTLYGLWYQRFQASPTEVLEAKK